MVPGAGGGGGGKEPCIMTAPEQTGHSWEPSLVSGVGGRGVSAEPSDAPEAEHGLRTMSVNSAGVRETHLLPDNLQRRENNDT